jgi:hypothetical protein
MILSELTAAGWLYFQADLLKIADDSRRWLRQRRLSQPEISAFADMFHFFQPSQLSHDYADTSATFRRATLSLSRRR